MTRAGAGSDEATLLIRATPASIDEAVTDIALSAADSAAVYEVERADGTRVVLYGVSVFARQPGEQPHDLLRRFAGSAFYLEASVGAARAAGFEVLTTWTYPAHFDG